MAPVDRKLSPPQTPGHISVARLAEHWYVACTTGELGKKPLQRTLLGIPMVLFRDEAGKPGALLDRCPHRNVPLSLGRVKKDGDLECCYHGWCFDTEGHCTLVPGLVDQSRNPKRSVDAYPVIEQDGFVWVYPTPGPMPQSRPFPFPHVDDPDYDVVRRQIRMNGSLHAVAENTLDVPHTAYLHRGLFRGGDKNRIRARISRWHDRVECEYIGEPRPEGLVGRILSPSGGMVEHWDRFIMPCIAQVEYKLGTENHVVITNSLTPVSDFVTELYAVICFRVRGPGWALKPIIEPLAMRVLKQDAEILETQTEAIEGFGGEQYMSTELDALGPEIWRLLRQAERGDVEPASEPVVKELEMEV